MHIKDHSAAMKFFRTYDSAASKGKWKEFVDEMEFDSMAQEPRNMYAQGQLVQNTVDGSRPGYQGKDKISFQDQHRTSGGTYKKMYSMEDIRKFGKELNVSEYNKKTGIKLTSEEYRDGVNKAKSRFNFYKNKFDSFSPKKKKAYMIDFNKQFVKQSDGIYHISTDTRMSNAKFVKKYFPNATGGSKIVTSINGMLKTAFEKKGNIIKNSPKADANAIRIKDLKKITDPTWETSTGVQGTKGSTLQHVASKNQMVKLNNLAYLEKVLNSSMSQNDKRIRIIENEVDRLLKTKPKNYVQRINALNTEGMALASGYIKKDGKIVKGPTAGYSEFRVKDPLNGKLSYFGKDESKMLLPDKDSHLIQKDSDLIGKNIKDMTIDEKKRAKQIAIDKQKEFKTILQQIGCPGKIKKADGGRISFQGGLSADVCMARGADNIKTGKINSPTQKANYNKMMKVSSSVKGMKMLKNILGPYGIGGEALIEGFFVANKSLMKGTPLKEAWQSSWMSHIAGGAYDEKGKKLAEQDLLERRANLGKGAQEFSNYNKLIAKYYSLADQKSNVLATSGSGDAFDEIGTGSAEIKNIDNKMKRLESEINRSETRITTSGGAEAAEDEYNKKIAETQDADAAKSLTSKGQLYVAENDLNKVLEDDFSEMSSDALPLPKVDTPIVQSYKDYKPDLPSTEKLGDMFEYEGYKRPDNKTLNSYINEERIRKEMEQPSILGASDTFFGETYADGGLANLMKKYYD